MREYAEGLSGWRYYSKKFSCCWRGSLTIHVICVTLIAVSLLVHLISKVASDLLFAGVFNVVGVLAILAEAAWLS